MKWPTDSQDQTRQYAVEKADDVVAPSGHSYLPLESDEATAALVVQTTESAPLVPPPSSDPLLPHKEEAPLGAAEFQSADEAIGHLGVAEPCCKEMVLRQQPIP